VPDHPLEVADSSPLPAWLVLALRQMRGGEITVKSNMQCSSKISATLPVPGLHVYHVKPAVCVRTLAKSGHLRMHRSNGTYVAYHNDTVFMTCITGDHRIESFMEGYKVVNKECMTLETGEVQAVEAVRTNLKNVHWLMLSREEIGLLAKRGM